MPSRSGPVPPDRVEGGGSLPRARTAALDGRGRNADGYQLPVQRETEIEHRVPRARRAEEAGVRRDGSPHGLDDLLTDLVVRSAYRRADGDRQRVGENRSGRTDWKQLWYERIQLLFDR